MGQMRTHVRLHLRGIMRQPYAEELKQLARRHGVEDRVHFLPLAHSTEMARLAACHDVGLALELNEPFHRSICLTNKIFVYLLAGLPVLLSDTPAQRQLSEQLGVVGPLVKLEDTRAMAVTLDQLLSDSGKYNQLRLAAWQLGQERYNWDVEQDAFIHSVTKALTSS